MKERSGLKKLTFGVAVMSVSVMLSKICGMFFKIPLTAILGTYGMGVFNTAYTVYSLLFVLCSAGLPSAIAISVSSSALACENKASPSRILRISVKFFGTIGLICAVSTYVLADVLAGILNNPESADCLRALSLCLFFTTVSGVLRGYFQGHSDMLPTAVSQVIEALGKLVWGVLFAWYANKNEFPISTVAAYAVLGVTFSSILGTVYLIVKYVVYKNKHKTFVKCDEDRNKTNNLSVLKKLLRTTAPITMSSLVMSVVGIIDLLIVMRLLGGEFDSVNDEYGAYSALATPIFNLPAVMIMPIAASALPL